MKISGFTFVRNADHLYFPIKESILSLLPLVDELHIALGKGDDGDRTEEIIKSIQSPKIVIHPRIWDEKFYHKSEILRVETNYVLEKCTGEWCIYLQADEVIHEEDYPTIRKAIVEANKNYEIDGLLLDYYHFWGDYDHYLPFHGWYQKEIRIIRNTGNIQSFKDAQSFRLKNGEKLTVINSNAHIFHYGWVRPPQIMVQKKKIHDGLHIGIDKASELYKHQDLIYDYGPMAKIPIFKGTHPLVMESWRKNMDWKASLNYSSVGKPARPLHKHEKIRYKVLTWIEHTLMRGKEIGGYRNWKLYSSKKHMSSPKE